MEMKTIIKEGIAYKKDTSYSDKLYDAIWTDGQNEVIVGGNTWRDKTGWEVKVNGVKEVLNSAEDGTKTRTSNINAFKVAKKIIEGFKLVKNDSHFDIVKDDIVQINKKQEKELLEIFTTVLRNDEEPGFKYGSAIILNNNGSVEFALVDHYYLEPLTGFKIEDYEKVFKILRDI